MIEKVYENTYRSSLSLTGAVQHFIDDVCEKFNAEIRDMKSIENDEVNNFHESTLIFDNRGKLNIEVSLFKIENFENEEYEWKGVAYSKNKKEKICLHKKNAHTLERNSKGKWFLDKKEIEQDDAISELIEAVQDLGYWCHVAKDVLPQKEFEMVQEAYEYHED